MHLARSCLVLLLVSLLVSGLAFARSNSTAKDARIPQDTAVPDTAPSMRPPAAMDEIAIQSHGDRINGLIYLSAGKGPHPVVIFLHGYPGNERNLDLAQAARRAGYQSIYIDYRGSWGSGGTFSFAHSLEDTAAVLVWVRTPENIAKYHLDPARIALVGHSMGGWLALLTAAHEPPAVCVAALDAWNVGGDAKRFTTHADERGGMLDYFRATTDPAGGPIRASADDLLSEVTENAAKWDYFDQAIALKKRSTLIVTATRDKPKEDLETRLLFTMAIRAAGAEHSREVAFDDDHPFSSNRVTLAGVLTHWLGSDCARTQAMGGTLGDRSLHR